MPCGSLTPRPVAPRLESATRRKRKRWRLKIVTLPGRSARHGAVHRLDAGLDAP